MGEFHRVTTADLKRMCVSAGIPFPEDEIDSLIRTCPKDNEGKVSFEDFIVHLERSQVEAISGMGVQDTLEAGDKAGDTSSMSGPESTVQVTDPAELQRENKELRSTIDDLENQLQNVRGSKRGGPSKKNVSSFDWDSHTNTVIPGIPTTPNPDKNDEVFNTRVTRSNNPSKNISKVFPDPKDPLPSIQVQGRKKFKVFNPPTEDIFGNKIQSERSQCEPPQWSTDEAHVSRPAPDIDRALLENVRACMDRNNKRALKDVTATIDRWNGGSVMTKRMLTKIIKHSGLRLPNETVRVLFDKLDVYTDGTVALRDFFQIFTDAETAEPRGGHDPAQISRDRRAEMQRRAAPWATSM